MCFSATASFSAGTLLIGVGTLTLRSALAARQRRALPFAAIPMLFAAQQLIEGVAWVVFRENLDRRIFIGMPAIVAGAVVLGCPGQARFGEALPALAVLGACLAWGIDNNLTRKVSLVDAAWLASVKGLAAGTTNLVLA